MNLKPVTSGSSSSSYLPKQNSPQQTELQRLTQKLAGSSLASSSSAPVNWNQSRSVTPGGLFGYKGQRGLQFASFDKETGVQLYRSRNDSHGLIAQEGRVVAASVTTVIKTGTARKKENKGTYIQYDKDRDDKKGKDFDVDVLRYQNRVNYEGGHLIDHKFSAQNSHYESQPFVEPPSINRSL